MKIDENKVVLVTGAGRGIGAACAVKFAKAGASVVLMSRTESELKQTEKKIKESVSSAKILIVCGDVSQEKDVREVFEKAKKSFGPISILVNNAGTIVVKPVSEHTVEDFDKTMAVNVRGSFLCAREMFRAKTPGAIVNISSLAGIRGVEKFPGFSAYTASKHAVIGLTENLAVEGRPLGIRVNCVAPGAVETRMLREAAPFLKTSTHPEDIANVVFFLCDEAQSSKVTGAVLEVNSNEG